MAGTVTAIVQNMSGLPLLRQVIKDGDASSYTKAPIYTMTVTTLQIGLYGVFLYGLPQGVQLLACNAVGAIFWFITFSVMWWYTPGVGAKGTFAALYLACVAYGILLPFGLYTFNPAIPATTARLALAISMQVFNISGFLSPLLSIKEAISTRSTRKVPRALSYVNALNSTLWTAYGVLLGDDWILWPNVAGVSIAVLQIVVLLWLDCSGATGTQAESAGASEKVGEGAKVLPDGP